MSSIQLAAACAGLCETGQVHGLGLQTELLFPRAPQRVVECLARARPVRVGEQSSPQGGVGDRVGPAGAGPSGEHHECLRVSQALDATPPVVREIRGDEGESMTGSGIRELRRAGEHRLGLLQVTELGEDIRRGEQQHPVETGRSIRAPGRLPALGPQQTLLCMRQARLQGASVELGHVGPL